MNSKRSQRKPELIAAVLVMCGGLGAQSGAGPALEYRDDSHTVTLQELQHAVPRKARSEVEKAEKARLKNQSELEIAHLKKAVLIDPEFIVARNNLAIRLLAFNPGAAIAELEEAIKINPRKAMLFSNLSTAYFQIRDFEAAERAARTAIALGGMTSRLRGALGLVLYEQHKYTAEAVALLERAADEYPMTHVFAAVILTERGELQSARTHIQAYLRSGEGQYRSAVSQILQSLDLPGTPKARQFETAESLATELKPETESHREPSFDVSSVLSSGSSLR